MTVDNFQPDDPVYPDCCADAFNEGVATGKAVHEEMRGFFAFMLYLGQLSVPEVMVVASREVLEQLAEGIRARRAGGEVHIGCGCPKCSGKPYTASP